MSNVQYSGYVLNKEFRYLFIFGGVAGILCISAFSVFMWYLTLVRKQLACGQVAVIFMLLAVYLIGVWIRNIKIATMRYAVEEKYVSNICSGYERKIELALHPTFQEVSVRFAITKSSIWIQFIIVSDKSFMPGATSKYGGLEELRFFVKHGAIILPPEQIDLGLITKNK